MNIVKAPATNLIHRYFMVLLLFLVALLPRIFGLRQFLTSDERTNIFIAGSDVIAALLRGDLRDTYWHFYPGVTMSWLDAIGMGGQYLFDSLSGATLPPFSEYIYGDILSLLVANRLPYVILTALFVPVVYLLARQLLPEAVALLGVLLLAFDPFFLAHSRVAHGDGPVTVFMTLSALTFFVYAKEHLKSASAEAPAPNAPSAIRHSPIRRSSFKNPYLLASAVFGGLAALTKAPGQFMALFVIGLSLIYALIEIRTGVNREKIEDSEAIDAPTPSQPPPARVQGRTGFSDEPDIEAELTQSPSPQPSPRGRGSFASPQEGGNEGGLSALESARGRSQNLPPTGGDRGGERTSHSVLSIPILHWLSVIAVWALVSLAVFVLLWPSMWVDPAGTFRQMWDETFSKVTEGHLVYFFGQPTLDPGPWFYLYVIPFRLTPVVFLGCLLSLFFLITAAAALFRSKSRLLITTHLPTRQTLLLLWLFVISLWLFGNLSPKKQDRYLLPLFPFLDLLAAIGWAGLISVAADKLPFLIKGISASLLPLRSPITNYRSSAYILLSPLSLLVALGLLLHVLPTFSYYPYYLTYFNPLMGGPTRAAETTLMGWGEGMEQVAAYLNTKPNAEMLSVAATPSQTLLPYFAGTGENFYTNDVAFRTDYVVLYLAQMQRLAPSPKIVTYFLAQEPEAVITIHDVPYARIYRGPKFILSDIPAEAIPLNVGLDEVMRLAGYEIAAPIPLKLASDFDEDVAYLPLTLYWHALAPIQTDYAVSVRARNEAGDLLFQRDQWPVNGLLPTSQWRQGDYVADTHTLTLPAELPPIDHFEIVVYEADSGQPLGPPIEIENQE